MGRWDKQAPMRAVSSGHTVNDDGVARLWKVEAVSRDEGGLVDAHGVIVRVVVVVIECGALIPMEVVILILILILILQDECVGGGDEKRDPRKGIRSILKRERSTHTHTHTHTAQLTQKGSCGGGAYANTPNIANAHSYRMHMSFTLFHSHFFFPFRKQPILFDRFPLLCIALSSPSLFALILHACFSSYPLPLPPPPPSSSFFLTLL